MPMCFMTRFRRGHARRSFDVAAFIEGAVTWGDTLSEQLESLDIYHVVAR